MLKSGTSAPEAALGWPAGGTHIRAVRGAAPQLRLLCASTQKKPHILGRVSQDWRALRHQECWAHCLAQLWFWLPAEGAVLGSVCAAEKERARNDTHTGTSQAGSELSQPQLVFSWQSHPGQAGGKQLGVVFSQPCPGQRSHTAPLAAVLGSHKDAPRGASGWYPSPKGGGLALHGQTPLPTARGAGTDQADPWERSF